MTGLVLRNHLNKLKVFMYKCNIMVVIIMNTLPSDVTYKIKSNYLL